jgi:hypothetical protein
MVGAVDDGLAEGTHTGLITHAVASADPSYDLLAVANVVPTVIDNDVAGVTVSPVSGLFTTEVGGTASFTVVLTSQPTANVDIALSSSDAAQGTPSAPTITFTPGNWNIAQTVVVTGQDGNATEDGNMPYQLSTAATSADGSYNAIAVADVSLTNRAVNNAPTLGAIANVTMNEDALPLTLPLTGIGSGQAGESQALTLTLSALPAGIVSLSQSYVSPTATGSFTITPLANQNGVVTVTATIADGGGTAFGGIDTIVRTFTITVNSVNDVPLVTVHPTGLTVNRGLTATVTCRLNDPANGIVGDAVNGHIGATDVETTSNLLVYQVQLIPSQGVLRKHASPADLVGTVMLPNQTFTQQELSDGLIRYTHNNGTGASDGFAFTVLDDNLPTAGASALTVLNITINLGQLPPEVVLHGTLLYTENQAPKVVDAFATVFDQDSLDFGGGVLTCSLSGANGTVAPHDIIGIINTGVGPGQIGVSGSAVTYGGTVIGNISGTSNGVGTDLAVTFTAACTYTEAEALLRNITFYNDSDFPTNAPGVVGSRIFSVVLTDGDGGSSATSPTSFPTEPITVTPINDAPTVASVAALTAQGVTVSGIAAPADPDGDPVVVTIVGIPVKGSVVITNAATGAFTYTPFDGDSGTDTFTIKANDGTVDSAIATVTLTITGGADVRPWASSDPELVVLPGDLLRYNMTVDVSDLPVGADIAFSIVGTVQAGMTITKTGATTAILLWPNATAPVGDYVEIGILMVDSVANSAGYQKLLVKVATPPTGGG